MRRLNAWGALVFLAGCGASITGSGASIDAASGDDAASPPGGAVDAGDIDAPPLGRWSTPGKVTPAATGAAEDDVTLSSDALELIFAVEAAIGKDLYYTSRASKSDPWQQPAAKLPFSATDTSEEAPRFSADDLTLYFGSDRAGPTLDIYLVRRPARGSSMWSLPTRLDAVSSDDLVDKWFMPCRDDRYVMAQGAPGGGTDIVEGIVGGDAPKVVRELSSPDNDTGPFLTQDCLTLYFASNRSGASQIYTSQRAAVTDPWPAPSPVLEFPIAGSSDGQEDPWLSPDGRTFAFARSKDIYLSTR
jgi:WD40-like Beta Propeller Repeat